MRHPKVLSLLSLAITLSLLMVAIPATPALATPLITLSPDSGTIGTTVTVTGTNFDSYRGDTVSIFFNNLEIANSPLTVPDAGSFSVNFDIPDDATPGRAWITVRSQLGTTLARSSFTIPEVDIKLDTEEGTVGTTVTVYGKGFYANKLITFSYYDRGEERLGTQAATPTGEYSYSFTVPNSTAGKHQLTAENAQGDSASTEFQVLPSITLNPTSGAAGETLTISGTGFGYRSEVAIYFTNTEVAYAEADRYGNFESTFTVPALKPLTHDVKVEDEDGNTEKGNFTITAGASLNKTTGNVGMGLVVTGTGFVINGTVTIKYDALEIATIPTNNDGAFSVVFDVPVSTSGQHMVTVTDGTSTKRLAFTMESAAPPAPALLLPEDGVKAKSTVSFEWEKVDDPSLPITYRLQVASDKNFTDILLEKKDLTEPEFTLTKEEGLKANRKDAPYYLRVKAVDGAANESEWSTPRTFYVGFSFALPGWLIYTLIGLGVLLIGFLTFWLGRRTAYYSPRFKP